MLHSSVCKLHSAHTVCKWDPFISVRRLLFRVTQTAPRFSSCQSTGSLRQEIARRSRSSIVGGAHGPRRWLVQMRHLGLELWIEQSVTPYWVCGLIAPNYQSNISINFSASPPSFVSYRVFRGCSEFNIRKLLQCKVRDVCRHCLEGSLSFPQKNTPCQLAINLPRVIALGTVSLSVWDPFHPVIICLCVSHWCLWECQRLRCHHQGEPNVQNQNEQLKRQPRPAGVWTFAFHDPRYIEDFSKSLISDSFWLPRRGLTLKPFGNHCVKRQHKIKYSRIKERNSPKADGRKVSATQAKWKLRDLFLCRSGWILPLWLILFSDFSAQGRKKKNNNDKNMWSEFLSLCCQGWILEECVKKKTDPRAGGGVTV